MPESSQQTADGWVYSSAFGEFITGCFSDAYWAAASTDLILGYFIELEKTAINISWYGIGFGIFFTSLSSFGATYCQYMQNVRYQQKQSPDQNKEHSQETHSNNNFSEHDSNDSYSINPDQPEDYDVTEPLLGSAGKLTKANEIKEKNKTITIENSFGEHDSNENYSVNSDQPEGYDVTEPLLGSAGEPSKANEIKDANKTTTNKLSFFQKLGVTGAFLAKVGDYAAPPVLCYEAATRGDGDHLTKLLVHCGATLFGALTARAGTRSLYNMLLEINEEAIKSPTNRV